MDYTFAHTSIRVFDLEKSLKFYSQILGLKEKKRKDYPGDFCLVFLGEENSPNSTLELTYNYNPKEKYLLGNGFAHLGFYVDDLEASYEKHKKDGLEVSELSGLDKKNANFYFITDPDGYSIEIIRKK